MEMFAFVAYRCRACRSRFYKKPPDQDADLHQEESEETSGRTTDVDTRR